MARGRQRTKAKSREPGTGERSLQSLTNSKTGAGKVCPALVSFLLPSLFFPLTDRDKGACNGTPLGVSLQRPRAGPVGKEWTVLPFKLAK